MNKELKVIEIYCKKCKKLMMEYFVCGDDSTAVLSRVLECHQCDRVRTVKNSRRVTAEGRMMKEHSDTWIRCCRI